MSSERLTEIMVQSQSRAEAYLHIARSMVMMQHESAQLIADALRAIDD